MARLGHMFGWGLLAGVLSSPVGAWAQAGLPLGVTQVMVAQQLPPSALSVVVLDTGSGRVAMSRFPDTPRSPASTIKALTTFAALDMLGPTFTWQTHALFRGTLKDGVLEGDLILQGGGDPYMTLERWWSFVQAVRGAGVKSIRGDIVIDNTGFALPPEDPAAFDGKPNRSYNVLPDALMVNFQSVEFRFAANADSRRVDVTTSPAPGNLTLENHIRFAAGRCSGAAGRVDFQVADEAWDRVILAGALSPHCAPQNITRVLLHPATYAFGTFVELWHESGGEFSGRLRIEATPPDATQLVSFNSLSMGEIVRLTNKFSSNLMARHLLLTVGKERFGAPATPQKGADAIAEWSREQGIDIQGMDIDNGSGLSRRTHISALQMAKFLNAAYHSRFAPEFLASLPLAGMDGTLRSRMKGTPSGSVRLKTGHIDEVSCVAGYVTAASGKTYVLVSMVNHPRADFGAGEPVHAALVAWIRDNL
jgi:D-alanyl-D-alanine carboxypeptidase/D-alanyl-D-alanine-endopeptidase (penicillin-binding protein 4)